MRALRSSLYAYHDKPPVTVVLLESDIRDTLESARHQLLEAGHGFVIYDIFEATPDIATATAEGVQRQADNALQESNQAMLYYWTVGTWTALTEGGTVFMDKPAPLSRDEIEVVFEQLALHPEYRKFHIVTHTREGEPVELVDGRIAEQGGTT